VKLTRFHGLHGYEAAGRRNFLAQTTCDGVVSVAPSLLEGSMPIRAASKPPPKPEVSTAAAPPPAVTEPDDIESLPSDDASFAADAAAMHTGAKGEPARKLMEQLKAVGAPATELAKDKGLVGPRTELWVKQFQMASGISPADGKVNETTLRELQNAVNTKTVVFSPLATDGKTRTTLAGQLPSFPPNAKPDGYIPLDQNKNDHVALGDQESLKSNLQDQGCLVTAFAMVSTFLGHKVTPEQLNDDKSNFQKGTPSFSSMSAAKNTGLTADIFKLSDPGAEQALLSAIDAKAGVMMRVDYKGTEQSDHSIVITGRSGNTLRGIDPATGGPVEMKLEADGSIHGAGWRLYRATEFTIVEKPTPDFDP
jgi:hypothetical protein